MNKDDLEEAIAVRDRLAYLDTFIDAGWLGDVTLTFGSYSCVVRGDNKHLLESLDSERAELVHRLIELGVEGV